MAYENFIPQIWSEAIQRELEGSYVFAEDCNRQWEGDVKKQGDTVHILGVERPEIKTLNRKKTGGTISNASADIDDPEEIATTDTQLVIDQIRYFNYMVGDIDKAQAVNGLMDALSKETSEGLADAVDTDIAKLAASVNDTVTATSVSKENILGFIDSAIEKLYEKKVRNSTELVLTISPRFYTLFKQAYINLDTNNHEMIKNGRVAQYGNVTVKMSTNVHKTDEGATDNIMLRTKRAIAFAHPLTHIEPYRPEKKFADAVKGFILYGTKIVRPDEIVTIKATY